LVYQKGINLLVDIIPQLVGDGIEIFVLGTGDPELENRLRALKKEYPDDIGLFLKYNFTLSHQVIASVDGFIIPSRYEPCGLTQLYSMKYGTVPIVRNTGGLADTVSEDPEKQTGFLFDNFDSDELYEAIIRAAKVYRTDKTRWNKIQRNGMIQDLSWEHRAQNWVNIYRALLEPKN
jgi:starch synthase